MQNHLIKLVSKIRLKNLNKKMANQTSWGKAKLLGGHPGGEKVK